jgi:hypothetical protein
MDYTQVSPKPEMRRCRMSQLRERCARGLRRSGLAAAILSLLTLAGCATYDPLTAYHHYEGGVIGQNPPPAPGLHDKFPNLASVPPKPPVLSPLVQRAVRQQLLEANQHQTAAPDPGAGAAPPATTIATAAPAPVAPPLLVGFQPGRAILSHQDQMALRALAAHRGGGTIAAIGFAPAQTPADLALALQRATAIANVLTEAGVPATAVRLEALTTGRGGAAQLL